MFYKEERILPPDCLHSQNQLLPELPDCWPGLWISDLPVPTITQVNPLKLLPSPPFSLHKLGACMCEQTLVYTRACTHTYTLGFVLLENSTTVPYWEILLVLLAFLISFPSLSSEEKIKLRKKKPGKYLVLLHHLNPQNSMNIPHNFRTFSMLL